MALSRKENLKQLKKLRSLTKGTDVGDQTKKISDKYYDGTNGATIKNALDGYIDSYEDHYKKQSKATKVLHNFKTFVNENSKTLYNYVFIDEGEFDEETDEETDEGIGYSTFNVYALEEDVDEHDNDYISELESRILDDNIESIGTAKIRFENESEEIIEVSDNIDINSIVLLYPAI